MAIVTEDLKTELRDRFEASLTDDVELRLAVRPGSSGGSLIIVPGVAECESCAPLREVAEALAEVSPHIAVTVTERPDGDAPVLEIARPGEPARVSFKGFPGGYEFGTLVDAIERVSRNELALNENTIAALEKLESDVELLVFVTPTCPYCPSAASMANRLALASPRITATTVEANEFAELSARFGVRGVPQTVVNQKGVFVGALPEAAFVEQVLRHAGARPAA